MTHVGDVHAENHAAILGVFDADRVVEVARVHGVDGEGESLADVSAVGLARERIVYVEPDASGLLGHRGGELRSQPVLANGDLDLDAGIAFSADDLLDIALRGVVSRGIARQPHLHDVAAGRITHACA